LALQGSPKVAPASREAILAAADELGYRPNRTASSLVRQRTHTIGVHILDLHNPVFAEILDGVQEAVRGHHYSTLLVTGNADPATEPLRNCYLMDGAIYVRADQAPVRPWMSLEGDVAVSVMGLS
jgi:DNA-binding LacI/PurR family transcriptional regulator